MTNIKPTSDRVVEFSFRSDTYMVSPHSDRGSALALNLQGQSMVIPVATLIINGYQITDVEWETPFSGRSTVWQKALLATASMHSDPAMREAT